MIPASYLFRGLYHRKFEQDPAGLLAEMEAQRGGATMRGPLDRITAAIVGFAFGSPTYVLGASTPDCPDRRR